MEDKITFVSGFFDIGRKTTDPMTNFDNYYPWINELLTYNINLIFYTTLDLHQHLSYNPRPNLKFIFMDTYPNQENLPNAKLAWTTYENAGSLKDTPEFAVMTHAKFTLINNAIETNFFNDKYYYWIDAGIMKIALDKNVLIHIKPCDKIRIMLMNYYSPNIVNQDIFLLGCRYCCAGGVFGGPLALMKLFCHMMKEEGNNTLKRGIFGLEQEYMYRIYTNNKEMFSPTFGYFDHIFSAIYHPYKNPLSERYHQFASKDNNEIDAFRSLIV